MRCERLVPTGEEVQEAPDPEVSESADVLALLVKQYPRETWTVVDATSTWPTTLRVAKRVGGDEAGEDSSDATGATRTSGLLAGPPTSFAKVLRLPVRVARYVDIYFSAGQHETDDTVLVESQGSCNNRFTQSCAIYRVRWDVENHVAIGGATRVVDREGDDTHEGAHHPSISPSSTALVFQRKAVRGADKLYVMTDGHPLPLGWPYAGSGRTEREIYETDLLHPHWYSDGEILLNAGAGATIETITGSIASGAFTAGDTLLAGLGADALDDAAVHQGPAAPSGCSRPRTDPLITLMMKAGGETEAIPTVVSYTTGGTSPAVEETFDLNLETPEDSMDPPAEVTRLQACHHPAWSIAGDRITCSAQQDYSEPNQVAFDGVHHRMQYLFEAECDGSRIVWRNRGRAIEPLMRSEYEDLFGDLYPDPAAIDHPSYTYVFKFAEWCGLEDAFVVTQFCEDSDDEYPRPEETVQRFLWSRVVLVEQVGSEYQYTDLTDLAEDYEGVVRGDFHGVYGTCTSPRSGLVVAQGVK